MYRPVSLRVMPEGLACADGNREERVTFTTRVTCQPKEWPGCRMLIAWASMRQAYSDVEVSERQRGKPYVWILRLRTDIVFFEDLRIEGLDPRFVYLPSGGMGMSILSRFTNDHFFACPRDLCYPYFSLLDLWESPLCDPTGAAPPGVFATVVANDTLTPNVLPTEAYSIPAVPDRRMHTEWFILARYSKDGACLKKDGVPLDQNTCGLVREFDLPYALARGSESNGFLECSLNLRDSWTWRPETHGRIEKAFSACQVNSKEYETLGRTE